MVECDITDLQHLLNGSRQWSFVPSHGDIQHTFTEIFFPN